MSTPNAGKVRYGCRLCSDFKPSSRNFNAERHVWVQHMRESYPEFKRSNYEPYLFKQHVKEFVEMIRPEDPVDETTNFPLADARAARIRWVDMTDALSISSNQPRVENMPGVQVSGNVGGAPDAFEARGVAHAQTVMAGPDYRRQFAIKAAPATAPGRPTSTVLYEPRSWDDGYAAVRRSSGEQHPHYGSGPQLWQPQRPTPAVQAPPPSQTSSTLPSSSFGSASNRGAELKQGGGAGVAVVSVAPAGETRMGGGVGAGRPDTRVTTVTTSTSTTTTTQTMHQHSTEATSVSGSTVSSGGQAQQRYTQQLHSHHSHEYPQQQQQAQQQQPSTPQSGSQQQGQALQQQQPQKQGGVRSEPYRISGGAIVAPMYSPPSDHQRSLERQAPRTLYQWSSRLAAPRPIQRPMGRDPNRPPPVTEVASSYPPMTSPRRHSYGPAIKRVRDPSFLGGRRESASTPSFASSPRDTPSNPGFMASPRDAPSNPSFVATARGASPREQGFMVESSYGASGRQHRDEQPQQQQPAQLRHEDAHQQQHDRHSQQRPMMLPPSRMASGGQYDSADDPSVGAQGWYGPDSDHRGSSHRAQFGTDQGAALSRMMPPMRRETQRGIAVGPQPVMSVVASSGTGSSYLPRGQSTGSLSEGGSSKSSLEAAGSTSALQQQQQQGTAQQSPMAYEQRDLQRKIVGSRSASVVYGGSDHHFHAMQRSMPYTRIPSRDDITSTSSGKSSMAGTIGVAGPPRHYSSVGTSSGQSPVTSMRTPTSVHSASPTIGMETTALYTLAGFAANEQPMRGVRARSYDGSAAMAASSTATTEVTMSSATWKTSSTGLYRPDPESMAAGDRPGSSVGYTDRAAAPTGAAMSPSRQAGAKMAALAVSSGSPYYRQMGTRDDYGAMPGTGGGRGNVQQEHQQPQAQASPSER